MAGDNRKIAEDIIDSAELMSAEGLRAEVIARAILDVADAIRESARAQMTMRGL